MWWIVFWFGCAFLAGIVASNKLRSGFGFFIYGLILPPIALIHALVAAPGQGYDDERQRRDGRRKCPHCAEWIKPAAKVCPFCKTALEPGWLAQARAADKEALDAETVKSLRNLAIILAIFGVVAFVAFSGWL